MLTDPNRKEYSTSGQPPWPIIVVCVTGVLYVSRLLIASWVILFMKEVPPYKGNSLLFELLLLFMVYSVGFVGLWLMRRWALVIFVVLLIYQFILGAHVTIGDFIFWALILVSGLFYYHRMV